MKKKKFVVSITLQKDKGYGSLNITNNVNILGAKNRKEAIGIATEKAMNKNPEHDILIIIATKI